MTKKQTKSVLNSMRSGVVFIRDQKRTAAKRRAKLAALNPTVRDLVGEWIPQRLPSNSAEWFMALREIERQKIIKIEAQIEAIKQYRIAVEAIGVSYNVTPKILNA